MRENDPVYSKVQMKEIEMELKAANRFNIMAAVLIVLMLIIMCFMLRDLNHLEKQYEQLVDEYEELHEKAKEAPIEALSTEELEYTIVELEAEKNHHSMDWDVDDLYLLAKIAMAEAEGESTEGKAMVIMVVLNRVWAEGFPDTIQEVIFESGTNGTYQFSSVKQGDRWWTTEPDEDCWAALELIYQGWDESEGALYFEATYNGEETWHSENLEYIKTVGNHNFYK